MVRDREEYAVAQRYSLPGRLPEEERERYRTIFHISTKTGKSIAPIAPIALGASHQEIKR
jgi:hypothetical protein